MAGRKFLGSPETIGKKFKIKSGKRLIEKTVKISIGNNRFKLRKILIDENGKRYLGKT